MLKWWIAAEHWYGQNDLAFILNQGGSPLSVHRLGVALSGRVAYVSLSAALQITNQMIQLQHLPYLN